MAPPLEISIPTTSLVSATSGDKAYTLYNITLRLPLRSFVIQKRYSEFASLHATLTGLVGEAPPVPLPAKSWFRSTVDSADLTETRRSGFEAYLRAVAESPDHRWRDTSAWRAFLNLPSTGNGSSGSSSNLHGQHAHTHTHSIESQLPAIGLSAANAAAASDPGTWLDLHKEMKKALHDARLQLARRDAAGDQTGSGGGSLSAAVTAGAAAKRELVKAGSLLTALTTGLQALQKSPQDGRRLGDGELRRRRDLLAAARVEKEGLETLSASLARASESGSPGGGSRSSSSLSMNMGRRDVQAPETGDRAALFAGASSSTRGGRTGGRVLGAPLPETERTRERDNGGMVQLQKEMMAEQDEQVETLARIVQRQRELGLAVKHEVDQQIGMLAQLDEDTERVGAKMKVARERTRRLG